MSQNNKDFKELQAKWYAKLKKAGFEDIESHKPSIRPEGDLEVWHSKMFQLKNTPQSFEQRETYYRLAGQFLYDYEFANEREKSVWQGHSEGLSTREISRRISKEGYGKDSVFKIVKRIRDAMLKAYGVK